MKSGLINSFLPSIFKYETLHTTRESRQTEQGFKLHHDWDERGRLQAQRLGGSASNAHATTLRNYHYDNLDRLVGIDDRHWGSERFELNNNGQITKRLHQPQKGSHYQYVTLFGYDSELNLNETASGTQYTDNVIPISQAALNKEQRQYDNAGRIVKTGRFTYHYDECGRAIQKTENKNGFRPLTTNFSWDEHDRLIRVELPNGERWRYRYDAFGRRVAKECERGAQSSQQVHYLYDGAQLIQQTLKTANGADIETTEYIYEPGSFRPVAQVNTNHAQQTEKLHYIVNDHSGTPRELCTEEGEIVWRGEQGLWQRHLQKLQSNTKQWYEDAANDPVNCDLRYQGQIEDKESGLYYNLNRYYDADSGQYLSSDSIGMLGGLRPQAYVHNPMEWVDPLGLANRPNNGKYHIFFDHQVDPSNRYASDSIQFRAANKELLSQLDTDATFRRDMLGRYPELYDWINSPDSKRLARSPAGLTWHHHEDTNRLVLVDRADHASNHALYHPTGKGGRDMWGGGR